jgi:hypothetical protein
MIFQKSQPIEPAPTLSPDGNPMGPMANMDASSPVRKAHANKMLHFEHSRTWPVRFYVKKRLSTKPVSG